MEMNFQVDESSKVPIYRQIADWMDGRIMDGSLAGGQRLLTERALCAQLGVARGTVKSAYEELERRGRIEKIQGRGTFVVGGSSQREQKTALGAIHRTLERFRAFHLGAEEIDAIMRMEAWSCLPDEEKIRVAWVDCSPELLSTAVRQLRQECNVYAVPFLIDHVIEDPSGLLSQPFDLISTSLMHYDDLRASVGGSNVPIERVALSLESRTVSGVARILPEDRVAVLYCSEEFRERVRDNLDGLAVQSHCAYYSLEQPLDGFFRDLAAFHTVIVPPDYAERGGGALEAVCRCRERRVEVLPFEYLLDKGSLIHLKEKAQSLWMRRALPEEGALNL